MVVGLLLIKDVEFVQSRTLSTTSLLFIHTFHGRAIKCLTSLLPGDIVTWVFGYDSGASSGNPCINRRAFIKADEASLDPLP